MNAHERQEISDLASRATDASLDVAGHARLEELLKSSAEARLYYVHFMGISAGLAWAARGQIAPLVPAQKKSSWRQSWGQVWAAAAVLVLATFGAWMMLQKQPPPAKTDTGLATLTNAVNIEWDQAQEPRHVANVLKSGWLRLRSGLAQVEFISGTSVWIEGPAAFRLDSSKQGYFESGRLIAEVPHGSEGFRVEFPFGAVIDRGTAFGLDLKPGLSTIQVLDGSVIITPTGGTATTYVAGQAVSLDATGTLLVLPSDPHVFDDMGYGWTAGNFNPLNPMHSHHDSAWGPQNWKGFDPLEALRTQLGVDATRWTSLKPVLSSYLESQWELKCLGYVAEDNDYLCAAWDLYYGTQNPGISDADLTQRLAAYRLARQDLRAHRDQTEQDLKALLTTHEEALLVDMGYLR